MMLRLRWGWLALLLSLGLLSSPLLSADDALSELVLQLKQGQVSEFALQGKGVQSADGLFLLGWLYDGGRYGVERDAEQAQELLQQAAELGQFDAMRYCWERCLDVTPAVLDQLEAGVKHGQPQALYLQSLLVASDEAAYPAAKELLLQAARQGSLAAMNRLYVEHFDNWAASGRSLAEARSKLNYCIDDGVAVCFYLLGALYEQHFDHQQALFYYQVLALVSPELYRSYLPAGKIAELLERPAVGSLDVVRSRAASYLAQRSPATPNDRIERYGYCRDAIGYRCVSRLAQDDSRCMLSAFSTTYLRDFRRSQGYRRCLDEVGKR